VIVSILQSLPLLTLTKSLSASPTSSCSSTSCPPPTRTSSTSPPGPPFAKRLSCSASRAFPSIAKLSTSLYFTSPPMRISKLARARRSHSGLFRSSTQTVLSHSLRPARPGKEPKKITRGRPQLRPRGLGSALCPVRRGTLIHFYPTVHTVHLHDRYLKRPCGSFLYHLRLRYHVYYSPS
jgi:hypothetical protein